MAWARPAAGNSTTATAAIYARMLLTLSSRTKPCSRANERQNPASLSAATPLPPRWQSQAPAEIAGVAALSSSGHRDIGAPWLGTAVPPSGRGWTWESAEVRSLIKPSRSFSSCLRRVMSRATVEAPTTRPSASLIGETVSDTSTAVPSFRMRTVSKSVHRLRPA